MPPIYLYSCESCGLEFEAMHKHDAPFPACEVCGKTPKRLIAGGTDFILKGTGWFGKSYLSPRIGSKSGKNVKKFK